MEDTVEIRQQRALAFAQALVQVTPPTSEDEDKRLIARAYQLADAMNIHELNEAFDLYDENEARKAARYREEPDDWYTS